MTALDDIAVVDLLREREEAFVQVWECEQRILAIAGESFRFSAPPQLPSRVRRSRAKRKRGARKPSLRRLDPACENAYRVRYEADGEAAESFQNALDLLRELLAARIPGFRILSVETVWYRGPDDVEARETLYC